MLQGITRSRQFGYFLVQNDNENQLDLPLVCRTKASNRLAIEKLRIQFGGVHIGEQLREINTCPVKREISLNRVID